MLSQWERSQTYNQCHNEVLNRSKAEVTSQQGVTYGVPSSHNQIGGPPSCPQLGAKFECMSHVRIDAYSDSQLSCNLAVSRI
jgi:hypothetical protein